MNWGRRYAQTRRAIIQKHIDELDLQDDKASDDDLNSLLSKLGFNTGSKGTAG